MTSLEALRLWQDRHAIRAELLRVLTAQPDLPDAIKELLAAHEAVTKQLETMCTT